MTTNLRRTGNDSVDKTKREEPEVRYNWRFEFHKQYFEARGGVMKKTDKPVGETLEVFQNGHKTQRDMRFSERW